MGFDIGLSRPRLDFGGLSRMGGFQDVLGLGGQARPGVPDALGVLTQLQQLMGGGAAAQGAASPEQLLRQLQQIAQTNPEALMQALRQNPQLAELLQMLLGGASPEAAARAQGGGAPRSAGGGGGGGGGGGSKGGIHKDGPGGFLWKPVSDSDGRLAILTPEKLTGQIAGVSVKDPSGRVIESGRPSGVGNGDREHFRFSRPGGAFPPGSVVEIKLKNGETVNYTIPNPSQRYD